MADLALRRHRLSGLAEISSRDRGEVRTIVLSVIIVLTFALIYVWQHIQVIRMGYRVEQLNSELSELLQEEKELTLRIARLKSLSRIEGIARHRFGMVDPSPSQLFMVSAEKKSIRTSP